MAAGYSGTRPAKKPGLTPGSKIAAIDEDWSGQKVVWHKASR